MGLESSTTIANDKNSFNGMFFYGHYNALGEDHAFAQIASEDNTPIRVHVDYRELGLHPQLQRGE